LEPDGAAPPCSLRTHAAADELSCGRFSAGDGCLISLLPDLVAPDEERSHMMESSQIWCKQERSHMMARELADPVEATKLLVFMCLDYVPAHEARWSRRGLRLCHTALLPSQIRGGGGGRGSGIGATTPDPEVEELTSPDYANTFAYECST